MERTRDEVRPALRRYMMQTGIPLAWIADQTGFAYTSMRQFVSGGRWGDGDGHLIAEGVKSFMEKHPWEPPELPGHLYETVATREMDDLISYCRLGRWATLYGPAGAQKSFLLEYRAAEAARDPEPSFAWIPVPGRMTPAALLRRIATAVCAGYGQGADDLRGNILRAVRARRTALVLALDEADLLSGDIDTLETLRRLGDLLGRRLGLIVAGNEQILSLFQPRRGRFFEQWRSRIEQRELRVLGPSREEARRIIASELGQAKEEAIAGLVEQCSVNDPKSRKKYVNARRLFLNIARIQEKRKSN